MTIVSHQEYGPLTRESLFHINNNNELSLVPKCLIDSKVLNLTNGDIWVLSGSSVTAGKIVWRKWKSSEEVECGWTN